jgi:hypothetical protein
MRNPTVLFLIFGLLPSSQALAWPETRQICIGEDCRLTPTVPAADKALAELRARERGGTALAHAQVAAAAAVSAGVAYGVGRYATYRVQTEAAAAAAQGLARETIRLSSTIRSALGAELRALGAKVVEANTARAAANRALLNTAEVSEIFELGLKNFATETRLKTMLRGGLGPHVDDALAAIRDPRMIWKLVEGMREAGPLLKAGGQLAAKAGDALALRVAQPVAKALAPLTLRATAPAASGGGMMGCLRPLARVGGRALAALVGFGTLVIGELIFASPTAEDSLASYYSAHPAELLELPDGEIRRLIREDARVAAAVVGARDVLAEMPVMDSGSCEGEIAGGCGA